MIADLQLRNYASTTQQEYVRCASNFVAHFRRSPEDLGNQDIREFLLHLIRAQEVSPSVQKMYVAALKFLYTVTLNRPRRSGKASFKCLQLHGQRGYLILEALPVSLKALVATFQGIGIGVEIVDLYA